MLVVRIECCVDIRFGDPSTFVAHMIEMHNRRDDVVVRASATQSVDLGFIPLVESYQKTKKMVFTASLLGARHLGEVGGKRPASSLLSLGKALNETPPSLCGRQGPLVAGRASDRKTNAML